MQKIREVFPTGWEIWSPGARLLAADRKTSADVTGSLSKGKADLYIGARTGEDGVVESGVLVQNASSIFAKSADGSREVPTVSATTL